MSSPNGSRYPSALYLLLQRFGYFIFGFMLVGKESRRAAFSICTFYASVNCFGYYLSFKGFLLLLHASYSVIHSLPDSSGLSVDFARVAVKVPSATTGHSRPVDTPRHIQPGSSLKWAVTEHEAGSVCSEACPWLPAHSSAPVSSPRLQDRSSCVLGSTPEGVDLLEASVLAPLHTLPPWGDLECPLSSGQKNKGAPERAIS